MTAATSANPTMRRAAPPRPAAPMPPARATTGFDHHEAEFRLDLRDIPRMRETMDIDGLKPTLLSRLFDMVAPLR